MSNLLSADTIYTLKLRRRGIDITRSRGTNVMTTLKVRDAMRPVPNPLAQSTRLADIIDRLDRESADALPVVDPDGRYRGTVTSAQIEAGARDDAANTTAGELAVLAATIRPDQTLDDALRALVTNDRSGLPVIDETAVAGWLTRRDVLRAYSNAVHIADTTKPPDSHRASMRRGQTTDPPPLAASAVPSKPAAHERSAP
jgi:CIC family chloride channel protein